MPTIPVNFTGASYLHRSRPLSAQVTRNLYPEPQPDPAVKSPFILHATPGWDSWNTKNGEDRGLLEHNGVLYHVAGEALYSIDSTGTATSLGTINGTARCIMEGIGSNVVVVSAGRAWQWNGAAVAEITDTDLETPNSCAHINTQMLYDGDAGRFCSSDSGDATSINALNYATAEASADDLVRVFVFNQTVYLFGEKTIETWYNSGTGSPPFDRIEGGIIQRGLAALHSVASNDQLFYWLGDDRLPYAGSGADSRSIATPAIAAAIADYGTVSDAIGWCMTWDGQRWYVLTFPAADKTWVYSENAGQWFELSSGVAGGRSYANSHAFAYGKHCIADSRSGNVYQLSSTTYDENGDTIRRVRTSGPLHGGLFGQPGAWIEQSRLEVVMEAGVGLVSGQGSSPTIMLQWSDDGGRTWSSERRGRIGRLGDYTTRVEWYALGGFYQRVFRLAVSDPIPVSIHLAAADVEVGL